VLLSTPLHASSNFTPFAECTVQLAKKGDSNKKKLREPLLGNSSVNKAVVKQYLHLIAATNRNATTAELLGAML
jgi:hypothetical protein